MVISDYRSRTVVLWQLILFGAMVLIFSIIDKGQYATFLNLSANTIISVIIGLSVYIYFWLKYKSVQSIIGKGDILFILFMTPLFPPRMFIGFMLSSFLVTLLLWGVHSFVVKRNDNIPLISGVGLCLSCLLIYEQLI